MLTPDSSLVNATSGQILAAYGPFQRERHEWAHSFYKFTNKPSSYLGEGFNPAEAQPMGSQSGLDNV